jgi:uncharacterized protein
MTTQISQILSTTAAHASTVPQQTQKVLVLAVDALVQMAQARRLVSDGEKLPTLVKLVQTICDLKSLLPLFQTNKCFRPERLQLTAIFQSYRPHLARLFNPTLQTLIRLGRKSKLAETETPTLGQCKVLVAQLEQHSYWDPEVPRSDTGTPLHLAVLKNDVTCIDALYRAGANLEALSVEPRDQRRAWTPLSLAARRGTVSTVSRLMALGADINANGGHPVCNAATRGDPEVLQLLLNAKAHVNGPEYPLVAAAVEGKVDAMELLLAARANPHKGHTLVQAVQAEEIGAVDLLLNHKVDVDAIVESDQDLAGWTALKMATRHMCPEIVARLLAARATVDAAGSDGWTALSCAAGTGPSEVIDQLIEAGASVDRPDATGRTPLSYAASHGYPDLVQRLLDHHANPSIEDNEGRTPLAHARDKASIALLRGDPAV